MKKNIVNFLIVLLIFFLPVLSIAISGFLEIKVIVELLGLPDSIGLILIFILIALVSYFSYSKFQNRLGFVGVTIPLSLFILILISLFLYQNTIKFTIKLAPFYLTIIMGLVSGYYISKREKGKFKVFIILAVFPVIMGLGLNDLWVHKIEYGNWTGEVQEQKAASFELLNKAGEVVNNETLKGKVVLFDFWFISCGPCWVKFPNLQRLYEKYQSNPSVEIYAVNRPMSRDKPGELFERIEEKGYSFPVLQGTQEVMNKLDVYKYPTVMVLNQNGEVVYTGELEDVEKQIEKMLESIN